MSDWVSSLSPSEREQWDAFVDHARNETVQMIESSAFVMSLVPAEGKIDVKFAVELGMAIMLGKPIVALAVDGVPIPPGLRRVAHEVIELSDLDTEAGREELAAAIQRIMQKTEGSGATSAGSWPSQGKAHSL